MTILEILHNIWKMLLNVPLGKMEMHYSFDKDLDAKVDIRQMHHFQVILFRYGHELLRNHQTGAFFMKSQKVIYKNEDYLLVQYHLNDIKASKTAMTKTSFPIRLISLHCKKLGMIFFRTEDNIQFLFPIRRFDQIPEHYFISQLRG